MSKTNWDDFAPVDPAVKPAKPTNWGDFAPVEKSGAARKLADTGLALGEGVVSGVQMLTNVAGADNAVSRTLGSTAQKLAGLQSPERRAEKQARSQKIEAAEQSGSLLNEIGANLGAFAEAPIDTTINALGTSAPTLAAAALTGGGSVAAQLAARVLPGLMGGAQGVGAVKGAIYDTVSNKPLPGETPEQAEARAVAAQSYDSENLPQIALGGGLGVLAGSTGIESAANRLMGKAASRTAGREATQATTMDLAKAAGVGALKEAPVEGLQGGQERVASNIALQNEGFDTPTFEGAIGQGVLEATASAPLGGGFGVAERLARNPAAPAPAAPAAPPVAPTGPAAPPPFVNPPSLSGNDTAGLLTGQMGGFERSTDPLRAAVKPSEAMGIDPSDGIVSKVAAAAVDGGATDQTLMDEARAAAIQEEPADPTKEAPADPDAPMLAAIESYNEDMQGMASPSMVSSRFGITVERAAQLLAKIEANPTPSADELFPLPAEVRPEVAPQDQASTGGASEVDAQGKPVAPATPEVADTPTIDEPAANVQDPQEPEAARPEPTEAARVEAPAPESGDAAADAGVPDAGGTGDAQAAGVTSGDSPKSGDTPSPKSGEDTPITKAELDKVLVPDMTDDQLRAGLTLYGAVTRRANTIRKEIQKRGLDAKSPAPLSQEPSNETQQEADARPNVPDEARQEADEEGVLSDGAATNQAVAPTTKRQTKEQDSGSAVGQTSLRSEPVVPENPGNGASADAELFGNLVRRKSFGQEWLDGFDTQVEAAVQRHMLRVSQNLQVLNSVVELVPVDVVNMLRTLKLTPKMVLDDPSVLKSGGVRSNGDNSVSIPVDAATAIMRVVARVTTEENAGRGLSKPGGLTPDSGGAVGTGIPSAIDVVGGLAGLDGGKVSAAAGSTAENVRSPVDLGGVSSDGRPALAAGDGNQGNASGKNTENGIVAKTGQAETQKPAPAASANTVFTEDAAAKARARLKAKLGRLNSGVDPEMLMDGLTLAGYHIEKGARTFAAFARAMVDDLGDGVKPFLKSWYMGVKYDPRAAVFDGMDGAGAVEGADVDALTAAAPEPKARTLTESLYNAITAGNMPKDNPGLKKLVEAFDGQPADQSRMKQAQEELETAIVMVSRDVVARGEGDRSTFDILLRLYESQPNLNIRTSTSIANQAYSTPSPLAFLASRLAGVTRKTVTHEPTAGTGMLLIGADQKKAIVNELNDVRITALKSQGFAPTQKDAATQALVPADTQPDAVVTNPPFGSVKDADGKPVKVKVDGYNIGQIDHLIAARALNTMKEDGRATLILGANKAAGGLSTDDRIFFNWLYSHYNVVGHFEVEGDLYNRQGAGWPVRVITINGRQKSSKNSPIAGTIQRVDNWSQVYEQFTQSLQAAEAPRVAPDAEGGRAPATGAAPVSTGAGRPAGGARGAGNVAGASPRVVPDRAEPAAEPVAPSPDEQRLNAQSNVPQPQPGQGNAERTRPAKPAGDAAVTAEPAQGNEFQVPYTPRSAHKDEGVLIPANMAQPTQDALSRLEDEVGDIDEFARVELSYDSVEQLHNALMGLQVDSVATAIYQIKQGKGVVIADQTGIGKGRQAASIIRWAARQGMTPVFVSVKPSLFTDMYGDLADIGTNDIQPFIMNSDAWVAGEGGAKLFANRPAGHKSVIQGIADSGQLPEGSNALFMTYSQINVANVQRQALMALAPNAVFVLDESHNAAGASQTGQFMIDTLGMAKGVTYLSATYAKRPDNMPLYFKTDIGEAAADTDGLAVAMASGGLPLQTVVSNNLVKAGQMFRRERSYDGVSIASVFDTPSRALHERMSNEATKALRAIVAADRMFHGVFVKQLADQLAESGATVKDSAGNQLEAGVQHTEFSSVVHNFVKQMLLGLKAQSAANEAIASLKRGEKPIIAVENTMGSFLNEYAASNGIGQGDSLGSFDYRTVLTRALMRSRVIIEVAPSGDKVKRQVSLGELDAQTRAEYEAAQKVIDGLTLDIPVSPIDWMRAEIQRAGFSVAEITGRNLSVDYSNPKKPILSAIDAAEQKDKVNTTRRFNSGSLDSLILNVAGSTGISLHASEKFEDQRQRHMIVAQAAGDINIFMQMLGRVHRTGQVRLPKYTILSVDLPTEKRPTAVLSIKMKSLNANTSSNTESATSVKSSDILNKYGDQIVQQYLVDNYALARALDLEGEIGGDTTEDIARKATGRLALQPIATQNVFYDEVEAQYTALIDYLNKTSQNDLEPRTFDFDAKETRQEVLFDGPNKDTPFGEDAVYGEYSIKAQGTPMKPEEIRAAMGENLGELTPAAHSQQMLDDLDAKFNAYYAGLDDGSKDSASLTRSTGRSFISDHKIGSTFRVEINSEPFNAVVLNVRNAHKETGNPFSLSKIQLTVAVNGALRSLSVPATQFSKIEVSAVAPFFKIEALFKEQPPNQRETAKIVTGNLLAAYGELQGVRGTIITFTKQDGTSEQGILLPKLFDYSKNTRGDYRLVDGSAALKFLQESNNKDIGRFGIMSRDGNVRVLPSGQGVRVQVPKSKLKGGKYFLDKGLIAAGGDFVSSGSFMVSTVQTPADAVKMLDLLMKKQALYALPSMADEAKALTGGGSPAADTAFLRVDATDPRGDTTVNANPTAQQAAANIRVLERAIARNSDGTRDAGEVRPYDARVLPNDEGLREIAAAFGSTLQGFGLRAGLLDSQVEQYGFFNGVRTGGIVFVAAKGNTRPHLAILGHELGHELRTNRPDLYDRLVEAIRPYIDQKKYAAEFLNSPVARNAGNKDKQREEFIGEVLSDGFMDRDFWRALGNKNPSLLRQIGGFLMNMVESVLAKVGYTKKTEKYLTDYKAVMTIAGEVMAEFGVKRGALGVTAFNAKEGAQNDTAFNVKDTAARSIAGVMNNVREASLPAGYIVNDFMQSNGKVSWWHKSVGTMYDLAQREPLFRPVFETAQKFLSDVSFYATQAADMAPTILPKLETLKDITKSPLAAKDAKAIATPIFEGTLVWGRDPVTRKPIQMEELEARAAKMSTDEKAQEMLRQRALDPAVMRMWQGLPEDQYNANINTRYENQMLKSGIVFTPAELQSLFGLDERQAGLYAEFRAATDKSLTDMAVADMVRFGGKDLAPVADVVLEAKSLEDAAKVARDYLVSMAEADPQRNKVLTDSAARILDKAANARDLMDRGYAPLSRFGKYSVDVVDPAGERLYFGLFESQSEANKMVRQMRDNYPDATIASGTMSAEAYKVFAGVTPETLELFGEMLGLESTGDEAKDKAFQEYLKLAKNQRSAMKRLIHRKGIAGFSEDPGRVLAGFIYSNSRQISTSLNLGNLKASLQEIPKGEGELADVAAKLTDYVSNPIEEAQAIRGLLFAQYLGGSVASAMLNALQPVQVTIPWLSQYGGPVRAASRMSRAMKDVLSKAKLEDGLAAAIKKAEEQGIVSPQEVFQLQAQAAGRASLSGGDGTRMGDASAAASNALSRLTLAWGKLFGAAEQFNRRATFIAAYRTAQDQRINDPAAFAAKAIYETQFVYTKANKPQWARGAIGATVFTFKTYSISYVELMHRLYTRGGPEGKRAALLGIGVLVLMSGVGGLPFIEDVEDVIDGFMQRVMNRNFSSKQAREQFFTDLLTEDGAALVMRGFSGLPGSPVDVSGRLGLGNLIPGTGIFQKKDDYGRDLLEIVGPAGDFGKRILEAAGKTAQGEVFGLRGALMTLSPVAARNLGIAYDMANTGSYQDQRGRKVIDTTGSEAAFKAIGFQPASVDKVQDATRQEQIMKSLNQIRETEIADKWARGVYLQEPELVQDARAELAQWNEDNPESPMRINLRQISERVKTMRMTKAERLAKTAPKELRAGIRERLERAE